MLHGLLDLTLDALVALLTFPALDHAIMSSSITGGRATARAVASAGAIVGMLLIVTPHICSPLGFNTIIQIFTSMSSVFKIKKETYLNKAVQLLRVRA